MNQIIEHRKLNKKKKMILTNHLIKVCRNLHWIETDITSSDEDIRNALYHYQSINRVIEILLKEGGTYRIETIRYKEEL